MAITNEGTVIAINADRVPSDFAPVAVATFSDQVYVSDITLTVTKATVENADPKVTLAAIVTDLNTQIDAILAADYVATRTVTAWANCYEITGNLEETDGDGNWLDNIAPEYVCKLKLYIKTAA